MRIPLHSGRANNEQQHRQTRAYRALLLAFGYPMRIHHLESEAIAAVIECLLDDAATVALAADDLAFKEQILATGAIFSETPAWIFADSRLAGLRAMPSGARETPEAGAMVIVAIDDMSENRGALCVQARRGTNLTEPPRLYFSGLNRALIQDHIALNTDYPRGVDLLLCAGNRVVALPRYLKLELV